jgi:hypothetical protein
MEDGSYLELDLKKIEIFYLWKLRDIMNLSILILMSLFSDSYEIQYIITYALED